MITLLALLLPAAVAAPNGFVPVQGTLTDDTGAPIDGTLSVTFTLYDAQGATTSLWTEQQDVDFDNGAFTAYLGGTTALDLATFRDNASVWLGVTIDTDAEMPRFQIASVPYAGYAAFAGDAASIEGMTKDDFLPSDWTVDPQDIKDVCYDTESELTALLDDNYFSAANGPDWTNVKNRPGGLDDGDDDTIYAAGYGIDISVTNDIALDPAEVQSLAQGVCYDTEAELTALLNDNYYDSESDLTALLDDNYSYKAGTGLTLTTNTFAVDSAWVLGQNPPWAGANLVANTAVWQDAMERVTTTMPLGNSGQAHRSSESGTGCYNWAMSQRFLLDTSQTYEFSSYIRAEGTDLDNYMGFFVYDAAGNAISGAWNNPYFKTGQNDPNTWTRWSGYLLPAGTTDANGDGIADTPISATNGTDWVMPAGATTAVLRFGTCYGDGTGAQNGWFAHPMVRVLDVSSTPPSADIAAQFSSSVRGPNLVAAGGAGFQDAIESVTATLPAGQPGGVHQSTETGTGCYNWARSQRFAVDPNGNYEFSVWLKSNETDLDNYMGFYVYDAAGTQIAGAWANPYFKTGQNDTPTWTQFSGLLLSSGTPDSNGDGIPDIAPVGTNGVDWRMPSNAAWAEIRYGACYGDGSATGNSQFAYPTVRQLDPPVDTWIAPAFANGWLNYGGTYNPAGYLKDADGYVHLRGLVRSGSGVIFTLPPGYRPAYRELIATQTNPDTIGRVDILPTGEVQMTTGNNTWFSLDNITFKAAQ